MVGPAPQLFFAPAQGDKRRNEWGMEQFTQRISKAQDDFYASARKWLDIVRAPGRAAIEPTYRKVLGGEAKPSEGLILSP